MSQHQLTTSATEAEIIPVPLLDLKAQYATIREEVNAAVLRVLESQHFILGPEVEALEEEVAAYSQCKYGIGVSSGTDALLVALMAIDIQPGDEVITTPYTFFATAGSVVRLGAKPVFVDIDPLTYNIDHTKIEAAITDRTRAIMPVHLYGQMADMDPIMDISQRYNLYIIEDAAQAIGAKYKEKKAGSIGHLGCFSFFPSKNLGGIGDGGMVVTNDKELANKVMLLRGHGAKPKYFHKVVGGNFRLDAVQGAVLRIKLRYLDQWSAMRRANAQYYQELFANSDYYDQIILPSVLPANYHIYNQFVLRIKECRSEMIKFLTSHKIGCEVYYPAPMHLQDCFTKFEYKYGDHPVSEIAAQETLAIPIYPELTRDMQMAVITKITDFYQKNFIKST
jgi:dTDP-4-amino-4,6-dideoxygalactose transaminase